MTALNIPPKPSRFFVDEDEAKAFVRGWLNDRGWLYKTEFPTGSGKSAIDFCLLSSDEKPALGIEVKPDIDDTTNASRLADYFEQAHGYSRSLSVPVLLGPALTCRTGMALHHGGSTLDAIPALVIFGGRANVGVAAWETQRDEVSFVLRGKVGYRYRRGSEIYDPSVFRMVRSVNSSKVRG